MILGGIDAGKSTFAKFLITKLTEKERRTALVDADAGQSFLGPPTTIGLQLFDHPPDWKSGFSPEIFFVGSTSPEGNFSLHLEGTKRMVEKALSYGAEAVLVDTTGLVSGEFGKLLKMRKIELLSPRFIFALQRFTEIEHILTLFEGNPLYRIFRLPLSERVRPRSMEERKAYREAGYRVYFKGSRKIRFSLGAISLEGKVVDSNGLPIPLEGALSMKRALVGLIGVDGDTLALGVIEDFDPEKRNLAIFTPLREVRNVKTLRLSSLKITPSYEEEKF